MNKNKFGNKSRNRKPESNDRFKRNGNVQNLKEDVSTSCKGKFNDPAWYTKIAGAGMAARKGFTRPTGRPFTPAELGLKSKPTMAVGSYPGIMTLHYIPAVGKTASGIQSPIDKAANKIWMDFRTKNTGGITYDAVDVILNLVAGVNIHAYYYELTRVYGLLHNAMITKNEYMPKALITELGYNYDNMMDHVAELGVWLNTISSYINSTVHIPKTFSLYDRYVFMNAGVYKDEDLDKYQMYVFNSDGYYWFNERKPGEAGRLELKLKGNNQTFLDIQDYFNEMWNRYALSESMADIQSGYYKFFGDNAFHVVPVMDLNYLVEPIYSAEMLSQIQNAIFCGPISDVEASTIIGQDVKTGFVDATYVIKDSGGCIADVLPDGYILNMFKDDPSENDVLEATRGMAVMDQNGTSGSGASRITEKHIKSCGSEIFTTISIFSIASDNAGKVDPMRVTNLTTFPTAMSLSLNNGNPFRSTDFLNISTLLDAFSYHPTIYVNNQMDTGDEWTYTFCDVANAVIMDVNNLENINELVIISQFTIT